MVYRNERTPLTVQVASDSKELEIDLLSTAGPMSGPTASGGMIGSADPSNIKAIMDQATKAASPESK
jgi:hypothetical protein